MADIVYRKEETKENKKERGMEGRSIEREKKRGEGREGGTEGKSMEGGREG